MKSDGNEIEKAIVEKAKALGASLAGIARIADLKASKSYEIYAKSPFYEQYDRESPNYFEFKGVEWREEHKSVLVWALAHPASEPRAAYVCCRPRMRSGRCSPRSMLLP